MKHFDLVKCLSKTRLSSWNIAPFLDNRLLNFSWVSTGAGADLLGDINALFDRFKKRYQFSDVLALSLWFQVTCFLRDLQKKMGCVLVFEANVYGSCGP